MVCLNKNLSITFKKEEANPWLQKDNWLNDTNIGFDIQFKDFTVHSHLYDIDVIGYGQGLNKLHLFDLDSIDENIVKEGISFDLTDIKKKSYFIFIS